jgi:hypothetical protein
VSEAATKKFLKNLSSRLKKKSDLYRKATLDFKATPFGIDLDDILNAMRLRVEKKFVTENEIFDKQIVDKIINNVSKPAEKFVRDLSNKSEAEFNLPFAKKNITHFERTNKGFKAIYRQSVKRGASKELSTFNKIKKDYSEGLSDLTQALIDEVAKNIQYGKTRLQDNKTIKDEADIAAVFEGRTFQLEHDRAAGVSEIQVREAMQGVSRNVAKDLEDFSDKDIFNTAKAELEKYGVSLIAYRDPDTGVLETGVFLGSSVVNESTGGVSSGERRRLTALLKELIKQDNQAWFGKGSDSLVDARGKKYNNRLRKVFLPLDSNRNIEVSFKEERIKGKKTTTPFEEKPRVKKDSKIARSKVSPAKVRKVSLDSGEGTDSLLSLQALLNSKLPEVVRKNMGAPALTNRTGSFASSVQVTEITRTKKGFPSVGYTYDKNPYQVFELGAGKTPWANADRDPRKLIDRSIREIAAELAVGRFFTRRV